MARTNGFEEVPDRVIANLVTCVEMPEGEVSPRTQATRCGGSLVMLTHLLEGDWNTSTELMEEFIQRLLRNAARQGIVLDSVATEQQVPSL